MLRTTRRVILAVASKVLVAIGSIAASAYGSAYGDEEVYCPEDGPCIVRAGTPGSPRQPGRPGGGDSGAATTCQYGDRAPVPCYDPDRGWYNPQDGCYYRVDEATNELLGRPGNYDVLCGPNDDGTYVYIGSIYLEQAPAGPGGPPSPGELAAEAVSMLPIRGAAIGIAPDPGGSGLVGLPVWMWTDVSPQTWGPVSATASVPGLSVTARARATRIVWNMGDGDSVICTSPGTPYSASHGNSPSPDCGHRYTTSSSNQPGGRYTVTATTTWHVTWTGGGASGALDVTRSSRTTLDIDELRVVVS